MDDELDPFELRLNLAELMKALQNHHNVKTTADYCFSHLANASDLHECILESFRTEPLRRRHIINLLETLCASEPYRSSIQDSFNELVELSLIKGQDSTITRPNAKALKSLLRCLDDKELTGYQEYKNRINEALGLSEAEQNLLQMKQKILEQIENDREGHKQLREDSWSRKKEESTNDEFSCLLHNSRQLSKEDLYSAQQSAGLFYKLNGITTDFKSDFKEQVIIIHIWDVLYNANKFLDSRDGRIRHAAEDFENSVKQLAKTCFFYNDLRDFDQPHVHYYRDDDDGKQLKDYKFNRDALADFLRTGRVVTTTTTPATTSSSSLSSDQKFYKERSYRYRFCSEKYDNDQLKDLLPRQLDKEIGHFYRELDELLKFQLSDTKKALERLIKRRKNCIFFFVSNEHLSKTLARTWSLRLDCQLLASRAIYTTTKYDLEWVLSKIKSTYGERECTILGNTKSIQETAEKLKFKYRQIRDHRDLENS